jgi:hypothetical protein
MAARSVSRRGRLWAWLLAAGVVAAAVRAYGATADDHRARRHHSPRLVGVVRGGLVHRHRLTGQRRLIGQQRRRLHHLAGVAGVAGVPDALTLR